MYKDKSPEGQRQCTVCGTITNIGTHHGNMPGTMWNMCSRHSMMASLAESRNPYYAKKNAGTLWKMKLHEEEYLFQIAYGRSIIQMGV